MSEETGPERVHLPQEEQPPTVRIAEALESIAVRLDAILGLLLTSDDDDDDFQRKY